MSEDPRYVEPRCPAKYAYPNGALRGVTCIFRAGHEGLHSADGNRWGTEPQLTEEIELREPDGVLTVVGDLAPEYVTAIRRAFRRRDLP